jgi:hypothetical protein
MEFSVGDISVFRNFHGAQNIRNQHATNHSKLSAESKGSGNVVMVCFGVDDIRIFISFKGKGPMPKTPFSLKFNVNSVRDMNWLPMLEYRFLNSRNSGL